MPVRRARLPAAALAATAALLLVAGPHPPAAQNAAPMEGDNSGCLCCHLDFDGEEIVAKHFAQQMTCPSCHGPSDAHRQDETLRTKPDLLWGRSEVDAFCRPCHPEHQQPAAVEQFRQQWLGKTRPNGRFIRPEAVCTDCHGEHTVPPAR